jgi:hypothetical protein
VLDSGRGRRFGLCGHSEDHERRAVETEGIEFILPIGFVLLVVVMAATACKFPLATQTYRPDLAGNQGAGAGVLTARVS